MSNAETRALLAAAASSVEGIKVTANFRQVTSPGAGMVRLDRVEYPNRFGGVAVWQVIVICPQEVAVAEKFIDEHLDALEQALRTEMSVTRATPQEIVLSDGVRLPCMIVEGTRETG